MGVFKENYYSDLLWTCLLVSVFFMPHQFTTYFQLYLYLNINPSVKVHEFKMDTTKCSAVCGVFEHAVKPLRHEAE